MTGLIVALDTADLAQARAWHDAVAPHVACVKLGLGFFCAHGPAGVRALGGHVFLDLKLHDIPATVAGAAAAVAPLEPRFLTLHAAGGAAMIAAARAALDSAPRPLLLAVTVLTSLDAVTLAATGVAGDVAAQVVRLARLALSSGADGLVCSSQELAPLRDAVGSGPVLVTPGIRPAGARADDQARTATPSAAAAAGADFIVVGRPITGAKDPAAAAAAIAKELT